MTKVELKLDKPSYTIGEKVTGTFTLTHGDGWFDKPVDVKVSLWGDGIESTKVLEKKLVTVPANTDVNQDGVVNADDTIQKTEIVEHAQSNNFWHKVIDLPLKSLGTPTSDGYITIDIGTKQVPFTFELQGSGQMIESYGGTSAFIYYELNAIVDKKPFFAIDTHGGISFTVVDPPRTIQNPNSIFEKSHNEYLTLELNAERDKFTVGESIKGKITLDNPSRVDIASVELGIRGIENASADNLHVENISYDYKQKVSGDWNSGDSRTVAFEIPGQAKRSYLGMLSKYSWEIAVIVTMSSQLGSNLYLTHPIQIV